MDGGCCDSNVAVNGNGDSINHAIVAGVIVVAFVIAYLLFPVLWR